MDGFPGTVNDMGEYCDKYDRVVPDRFDGDAADNIYPVDKFTQNLIANYAIEGYDGKKIDNDARYKSPTINGRFFMKEATLKEIAYEILKTHFSMTGKEADDYVAEHFHDAFKYYDVNLSLIHI